MFYGMEDQITEWAQKNWKVIIGAGLAFFFFAFFREIFFLGAVLGLTVIISTIASRTKTKLFGIELVTFSTVLIGYTYGAVWGCIAGIALEGINSMIVSRWVRTYNMWVIPSFGAAGIIAGLGSGLGFTAIGVGIAIGLHVFYAGFSLVTHGRLHPKYIIYAIPNIIFNIFLFAWSGNFFLSLLG